MFLLWENFLNLSYVTFKQGIHVPRFRDAVQEVSLVIPPVQTSSRSLLALMQNLFSL